MNYRRVLNEYTGPIEWTLEEADTGGKMLVSGKVGQGGKPTANRRNYPTSILEREVARLQPKIKAGGLVGSLDHPGDGKSRLKDASHIVRALEVKEDGSVHGTFEIVQESDNGRNLAAFIRAGASIGMSSRGMGSTKSTSEGDIVGEDFKLTTFDFVAEPAVSDAFPVLVTESEEGVKPTAADLTAKYPELVQEIQEGAYEVAQRVIEEATVEDREALMKEVSEETLSQLKAKVTKEVRVEVKTEMADEFSVKLTRALQGLREEIEKEVRADLASDPREAAASIKLSKIGEMLGFSAAPKDAQSALAELETVQTEKKNIEEKAKEIATTARNLAWKLYLERTIGGRDDADIIREMVDVGSATDGDDLKARVAAAITRADSMREDAESRVSNELEAERERLAILDKEYQVFREETSRKNKEITKTISELTARIADREDQFETREDELLNQLESVESSNDTLTESLQEAKALAEELESMKFAAKRTRGHPRRGKVLEEVKRRKLKNRREINKLAEEYEDRAEEPGGVHERVRQRLGRGREHRPSTLHEATPETGRATESISDLEDLGIDQNEILSAIKRFSR